MKKLLNYKYCLLQFDFITYDILSLKLKPKNKHLEHISGQYCKLLLSEKKHNYFSIANSPNIDGILELHIRTNLKKRDNYIKNEFLISGPIGNSIYQCKIKNPIVLIASGMGIVPFYAILQQAYYNLDDKKITLLWIVKEKDNDYIKYINLPYFKKMLKNFSFKLLYTNKSEINFSNLEFAINNIKPLSNIYISGSNSFNTDVFKILNFNKVKYKTLYSDILDILKFQNL